MKKYFFTGLAVLLPVTLTILLVLFIFNVLTAPFEGIVKELLSYHYILEKTPTKLQQIISQFIILIFLFFLTVLLGIIGSWLIVKYLIHATEKLLQRIPFIRAVYNTCKDVIKTLFTAQNKSFKQVVLVPYPNLTTYCIGFVTRDDMNGLGSQMDDDLISVFVPCTPNPTSGFLMMFKSDELIFLNIGIEDAFKYIISCGVVSINLNTDKDPNP